MHVEALMCLRTNLCGHSHVVHSPVGTIMSGHNSCWSTTVSGHKRVWGTVIMSHVVTVVWAQSCVGASVVEPVPLYFVVRNKILLEEGIIEKKNPMSVARLAPMSR